MRARGALASVARSPIVAVQSVGQEIASQTMSGRTIELDDRIYAYLLANSLREPKVRARRDRLAVEIFAADFKPNPQPTPHTSTLGPQQARAMSGRPELETIRPGVSILDILSC